MLPSCLRYSSALEPTSIEGKRGVIWIWRITDGLYATEVRGHLDREMAGLIVSYAEPLYAHGSLAGFHHWFEMTGYDSRSRVDLPNWVLRHRAQSRLNIGMKSKLVAMGVSVANLALGNLIETFASPAALETALERFLREHAPPA